MIRLPEGAYIPKRVQQITGISPESLSDAVSPRQAWKQLCRSAEEIRDGKGHCLTVIHFCRYETPFLKMLHRETFPGAPFPLTIICTHEIVRLLLPGLPRKGLRAVAGYFGHPVAEERRAAEHVAATGVVWHNILKKLETSHGIRTDEALSEWLKRKPNIGLGERSYPMDRKIRSELPHAPGVYRMRRSNRDILYVGKARSLKNRVNSYFQKHRKHPEHIMEMLTQAKDLDVKITGSALEAAVVESDEIKSLAPPYNIALRKKERKVFFCSKDLSRVAETPDRHCCLGPLPSADLIKALFVLAGLIDGKIESVAASDIPAVALCLPSEDSPDMEQFYEGFHTFCNRHRLIFDKPVFRHAIIRLGADLWRQRILTRILNQDSEADAVLAQEISGSEEPWVWTPDAVSDAIESRMMRGAHFLRRARWFLMLSEASLAWESRDRESPGKHVIVFEGARIASKEMLRADDPVPVPPGHRRTANDRRKSFDVISYDRMRVVTTEIRRLLSDGRGVEIRLTRTASLKNPELERLLGWI